MLSMENVAAKSSAQSEAAIGFTIPSPPELGLPIEPSEEVAVPTKSLEEDAAVEESASPAFEVLESLVPNPQDFEDVPTMVAPRPTDLELPAGDATTQLDLSDAIEMEHRDLEPIGSEGGGELANQNEGRSGPSSGAIQRVGPPLEPADQLLGLADGTDTTEQDALLVDVDFDEQTQQQLDSRQGVGPSIEKPTPVPFGNADGALSNTTIETIPDDLEDDFIVQRRRQWYILLFGLLLLFVFGVVGVVFLILTTGNDTTTGPGESNRPSLGVSRAADASPSKLPGLTSPLVDAGRGEPLSMADADTKVAHQSPEIPVKAPPPAVPTAKVHKRPPTKGASRPGGSGSSPRGGASGRLFLHTSPYSKVRVAGRNLGTTPIVGAKLPAGSHTLILTDPTGKQHRRRVRIRSGAATKMSLKLR